MFSFYKFCTIVTLFITIDTISGTPVSKKDGLKDLVLELQLNVPEFIQNLTGLRFPRSRSRDDGKFRLRIGVPDFAKTMATIGRIIKRRNDFAYVEIGPGAFKSEIVTYPPKYHENQLKKLLRLKEKKEEKEASKRIDLNAGKEFFRK